MLGTLALGDVLHGAEPTPRPAHIVRHKSALSMDKSYLAIGPGHAVLHIVAPVASQRCHGFGNGLPIVGMNQGAECGEVDDPLLRTQPKDAVGFIRPGDSI